MSTTPVNNHVWGGWGDFLNGARDTFGVLLEGGLMYEQFRQQKDQVGAGQHDVVNSVQRDSNPNAAPLNPNQYRQVSEGAKKNAQLLGGVDGTTLLVVGGLIAAALVFRG